MYANGFFEEQQRRSPASLALVVALHAAGFGALILAGGTQFLQQPPVRTTVRDITIPPDPEPVQPDEPVERREPEHRETVLTTTPRETTTTTTTVAAGPTTLTFPFGQTGEQTVAPPRDPPPDPPAPVRREPQLDSRYARDLQPPYPPPELRRERDGFVRIRLTIGPNGRVTAVQRLAATSDAFWDATQRQALGHWRFRPATLDGRPVQGVKDMTVNFRIQDAV